MATEKIREIGECQVCHKKFYEKDLGDGVWFNYDDEIYSYRGFNSCEACFDKLQEKVDDKRQRIIENQNSRALHEGQLAGIIKFGEPAKELIKAQIEIASKEAYEEKEWRKGKL